ncbi:MAG TPA: hypothetical protein VFR37_25665 [Longimicrobium sp.]|nr:hypothetical protein [Longimicrobium sp.]
MKRLKLQAEALEVESFPTGADDRGDTALEFLATRPQVCDPFSLPPRCS